MVSVRYYRTAPREAKLVPAVLESSMTERSGVGSNDRTPSQDVVEHERLLEQLRLSEERFVRVFRASMLAKAILRVSDG